MQDINIPTINIVAYCKTTFGSENVQLLQMKVHN